MDGLVSRNLTRLSAPMAAQQETKNAVFASTGVISAEAQAELGKLGWESRKLD